MTPNMTDKVYCTTKEIRSLPYPGSSGVRADDRKTILKARKFEKLNSLRMVSGREHHVDTRFAIVPDDWHKERHVGRVVEVYPNGLAAFVQIVFLMQRPIAM